MSCFRPTEMSPPRTTCSQNCSGSEWSHLPNSKITAQMRRALSTSLPFDPNKFTKGMIDQWNNTKVDCGLLVHAVQHRENVLPERNQTEEEEEEGRAHKVSGQLFTKITQIPPPESGISTSNSSWLAQWRLSSLSRPMRVQRRRPLRVESHSLFT